jgi:hypothetical protein
MHPGATGGHHNPIQILILYGLLYRSLAQIGTGILKGFRINNTRKLLCRFDHTLSVHNGRYVGPSVTDKYAYPRHGSPLSILDQALT